MRVTSSGGAVTLLSPFDRSSSSNCSRPFAEVEAGIDWSTSTRYGCPFARVGVVGQQWFNAGSPTSTINNKSGDLGMFGLQVILGVRF